MGISYKVSQAAEGGSMILGQSSASTIPPEPALRFATGSIAQYNRILLFGVHDVQRNLKNIEDRHEILAG